MHMSQERSSQFTNCYDPTWGRQKARTFPSVGNHEYLTKNAAGYFSYFGAAAGDPQKGYYSYDLGAWHIVVINANCSEVGGCGVNSPQGAVAERRPGCSSDAVYPGVLASTPFQLR